MLKVAIGWAAWELSHSAFWTGLVAALYMAPAFFLSPVFGVMADRIRLKRGVKAAISAQIMIGLSLALASWSSWLSIERLALFSTLFGTISAAYHPMRLTVVGRLVEREFISATVGLNAIAFNTSRILGPALAGLMLASFSTAATMLTGALLYLPYLTIFHTVRLRNRTATGSDASPWINAFIDGLHYARQLPIMLPVVLLTFTNGMVGRALFEMLPAVAGDLLNAGASTLAALTAAAGAGAVLAGVVIASFKQSPSRQTVMLLTALAVCCLATAAISVSPTSDKVIALCALAGFSTSFVGISSQTLLQLALDDQYRGRVMSLWTMVSFGSPALGALLVGYFAEQFGLATGLAVTGLAGVALCALITPLALSRAARSP